MPDNSQWWQNAQPGEKPWEAARRAKEAKAKPQETRGVLRRAWDALNRPVIPVERGVRAVLPEDQMGPVGEHAAGGAIGLGRVAESLSSPAALGSLGTIGLLSRPGVLGDILMAFLSGDMGWEAIKNLRRTNDTDYGEALPREKTADYTAATAHGALAVAPWLHMGARAARNRPAAPPRPSQGIPDEFRVNVDPEVRAQVDLPLPRPESPIQPSQGRPAAPRPRSERLPDEAIREMEARNRAEEAAGQTTRQIEADRVQAAREAALAEEIEKIRQLREDPLTGDENVRRNRDVIWPEETPAPPETPWREFEDALGAEIVPKPAKPPKFRDQRIPVEDPYRAAIDFLLEQGGINIKATKKAGTYEDWRQSLPPATWRRVMRQKGGFSPDDMAMNMQGFGIEGENHLREILSRYQKREPLRITKDEQMRQYEQQQADWERRMREEVPPEWMKAMEVDTFNDRAVPFRGDKALMRDPEFIDYDLLGMRRPGEEGFARFMDDRSGKAPKATTIPRLSMDPDAGPTAGFAPNKTVTAYKLFRTNPKKPGELFPLFVDANTPVPIGEWVRAKPGEQTASGRVKSKLGELAYRPGWHSGEYPAATHIGGKSSPGLKAPDYRPKNQVWAEVEIPADVDWQSVADSRATKSKKGKPIPRTAHITDQVPLGGHYRYKTNPNMQGSWLISGDMKVKRVLSDQEVIDLNSKAGFRDLPRLKYGDEGFADFGPDKGYGYYPDEFTLIKVSYNAPDGLRTFYDVVQGATGKRALRMGRDMHPDALSVELDVAGNEGGFADIKQDKPKPVSMFADELLGAQARQRQEAQNDLFQRILQADPAAVSKRELLGLDKGKKKKSGSTPLLDTVKTQGSMFGE